MINVTRMPFDPGPAAWNELLPEGPHYSAIEGACTADWLVVGAGFAGLSAARRLQQLHPNDRIVLIEARSVCEGPAGRNSGFMIDLPHNLASSDYAGALETDRLQTAMNRAAIAFARDAVVEHGFPAEAMVQSGKINAAATRKGSAQRRSCSVRRAISRQRGPTSCSPRRGSRTSQAPRSPAETWL